MAAMIVLALFAFSFVSTGPLDEAPRPEDIVGRTWSITEINGEAQADAEIVFYNDDSAELSTACRSMRGGWGFDDSGRAFALGGFESEELTCGGPVGAEEGAVLAAFARVDSWALRENGCSIELRGTPEAPAEIWLVACE